ncbi:Structural maintenance of chromosomes protein 1A [Glugoides intestinalis]
MLLDKVEINNFKSYRGKHLIGPFDKFSCIVGPNGSGKSNVLDAISFALNVPNECLRVKSLKSLIEQNSIEASVKMRIGTTIFERIVYKSGQSQNEDESIILDGNLNKDYSQVTACKYYFNEKKVTQKSYNEELERLNILSKIRNFVIYQGDILKIDIDLLKMFENVCGSDNYIEEYNMLADKIAVLNKNLSLKYEKRKDCLSLMKEMKDVKDKEKAFASLVLEKEALQRKIYQAEIKSKRAEVTRLKSTLASLEKLKEDPKYNEVLATVNRLRSETAKLQKEYFEKETELTFAKSKQTRKYTFDFEAKSAELKSLQDNLRRSIEEMESIGEAFSFEQGCVFEGKALSQEDFENLLLEKEKEYTQRTLMLEKQLSELTLRNFDKISKRDQLQHTIKNIVNKSARIKARNLEIDKENKLKKEKITSIEKEIENLELQIQGKSSAYENILSDEEKLKKELNATMRDILLNKAKKNDVLKRSMVKNVVENLKTIFSGVHGRVIDLIEPIQKKYEVAVGVLLSKHDQSVVVDNEKTALDCLRYIKDTKSCKLTFIPLNKIKSFSTDTNLSPENSSNIKRADFSELRDFLAKNCIKYSSEYDNVVLFILKASLIVDTVEKAKHLLYNEKYPGKICTIDGTLFTPGGLITGGKVTINKFEDSILDHLLSKRLSILNDMKMNKDRKEAFSDVTSVKTRIEDLKQRKSNLRIENVESELADELDAEPLKKEMALIEKSLEGFETQQKAIKEAKKNIERNVFVPLLHAIKINTLSEYKERIKQQYRHQELLIRVEMLRDKIALVNEEIAASVASMTEKEEIKDLNAMEEEINRMYINLENLKEKLRSENQIIKSYTEKRGQVSTTILNHQIHLARVEEDLKDLIKYAELETNYKEELDISELSLESKKETLESGLEDIAALKRSLEEINSQLSLNVPTVSSADTSIQSKFSKMNREYETAKNELLDVKKQFQEVKRRRMDTFGRCFSEVSSEIAGIYRDLTRDDNTIASTVPSAYLVYEGDPFTNNIKYYLMPPSKRFVPFQELSGGERSIALLSFLFALSRFRKPPFYIFDEVDSALDKTNVERLSRHIRESSDQFLIISLKPQFFSRSDSLFGVYKCPFEQTSKVLSVKLD